MKGYTIYKSLLLMAAPLMLASCSNSDEPSTPSYEFGDFEGIMLNVPYKVSSNTRADETSILNITEDEAKISSLTVFAYDQSKTGSAAIVSVFDTSDFDDGMLTDKNYKQLPVVLPEGTYHIYVVANITSSMLDIEDCDFKTITESQLSNANIEGLTHVTTISENGLPMSCNYDVVKPSATAPQPFTNGEVKIEKKKTTAVYADLTYAVAKVRYTILNGANSTLKMAETTPVHLENYATTVGLMTGIENYNGSVDEAKLTGAYYAYPENATGNEEEVNLDKLSALAPDASKWAYQGLVYVPERLFDASTTNPTKIAFKFSDSQYDTSAIRTLWDTEKKEGVKRGVYYDVVGHLSSKDLQLMVKVKEWQYHKYTFDLGD